MIGIQALQNTYQKATTKGLNYVNEYWKEERKDETGRTWKNPEESENNITPEQKVILVKGME